MINNINNKLDNFKFAFNKGNIIFYIHSFSEYNLLISILNDNNYYFRAQSNPYWTLENSYLRLYNSRKEKKLILPDETGMIREFFDSKYCDKRYKYNKSLLDIIAEMQHYGAPTRLLDFTHSSLIASYFSIKDTNQSKDEKYLFTSSLFLIKKDLINMKLPDFLTEKVESKDNFDKIINKLLEFSKPVNGNPQLFLYTPDYHIKGNNSRINKQKGLFVFTNNSLENIDNLLNIENTWYKFKNSKKIKLGTIDSNFISENIGLIKIVLRLSNNELLVWLKELDNNNINEINLFPDKEGFLRNLNLKII